MTTSNGSIKSESSKSYGIRVSFALSSILLALGILWAITSFITFPGLAYAAQQKQPSAPDVGGTIVTHTTWTQAGSPYLLTSNVIVNPGIILTVEPGVVVQGNSGTYLQVQGHLDALGTIAQPITFTSATNTGPDQWAGLLFDGGTGHLQYATIRYAGQYNGVLGTYSSLVAANVTSGEVRLEHSQVSSSSNQGIHAIDSWLVLSDTLVAGNGSGIYNQGLYASGASTVVTVTASTFQDNAGYGLYSTNSAQSWVTDSTFTGNGNYPLFTSGENLHRVISGNTFAGNTPNRLLITQGTLGGNLTLPGDNGLAGYELANGLTVPAGRTLTLAPDVVIQGQSGTYLQVQGHLEVLGTDSQPVTFTSATDTGSGQWAGLLFNGGTGHLQYATIRYAGQYNGVLGTYSNLTAANVITGQVRLEHSQVSSSSTNGLQVMDSRLVLSDTLVAGNGSATNHFGLSINGLSTELTITASTIQDNTGHGLYIGGNIANASIVNSVIRDNNGYGIQNFGSEVVNARGNWWGDPSGPGGEGPGIGDEVSGKVLYDPWLPGETYRYTTGSYNVGTYVWWKSLDLPAPKPEQIFVRVGNNPNPDSHWTAFVSFTSLPADLGELPPGQYLDWFSLSTNPPDPKAILIETKPFTYTTVRREIINDTTWQSAESPFLVTENAWVLPGTTLRVEPGVTVYFSGTTALRVDGELLAIGTSSQPITFTSWYPGNNNGDWGGILFGDTAVGARYDGNGNYMGGSALQYFLLEYAGAGVFEYAVDSPDVPVYIDHVTIQYSASGGLRIGGGKNKITNSIFQYNDGAGLSNTGSPVWIANNQIRQNTGGGIANNAPLVEISTNTFISNTIIGSGGGIYDTGGAEITGNTVQGNTASVSGGGIYSNKATVSGNTVAYNQVSSPSSTASGGGIFALDSLIIANTVINNSASGWSGAYGGGIFSTGNYTLTSNIVQENTAIIFNNGSGTGARGGGIYSASSDLENNIVKDNQALSANSLGGGVYISDASIRNNQISLNNSEGEAGGVYWVAGNGDFIYNTIVGNTTTGETGGLYVLAGYPTIHFNGLSGNYGITLHNQNPVGDLRLDARYNWWGTSNEDQIFDLIYDWFDDFSLSFVDFKPFLADQPNLIPGGGTIDGRVDGLVNSPYRFDTSIVPVSAIRPITYTWEATNQVPIVHVADALNDAVSFSWTSTGVKTVKVTAQNREGFVVLTHTITIVNATNSDTFESDDLCEQAKSILTTGITQFHTFHTSNDVDWISFNAVAGTTYIIEATTPDESSANLSLEMYDTCSGTIQDGQNNSFSPDISLTMIAPKNGSLFIKLNNTSSFGGDEFAAYYLSVRALSEMPEPGAVVLVAGKNKDGDTLQANIYQVTNAVYRMFINHGYPKNRIYYLAPDTNLDADGDGNPDANDFPTKSKLEYAITTWAKGVLEPGQPFTVFMMDHGGYDNLYLNKIGSRWEKVTSEELNTWLDELDSVTPGLKMNVIVEACQSGSFIDLAETVSKPGRVIISSTGAYPVAYASPTGAAFSDAFISALNRGMSLNSSFSEARWALEQAHPDQTPWLDDDGDGVPNETEDGQIAAQRGFAFAGSFSGNPELPPYITTATFNQGGGWVQAQVAIESGRQIASVWAVIYPPSYKPPSGDEDLVVENVPQITLTENSGIFTGNYPFPENGTNRVVIYAVDEEGFSARAYEALRSDVPEPGLTQKIYLPIVVTGAGTSSETEIFPSRKGAFAAWLPGVAGLLVVLSGAVGNKRRFLKDP